MDKIRIQNVAEEAGLSTTELIKYAKKLGFDVKAANSTISLEEAGILVDYAITGILPKNLRKVQNKKSKINIIYKTPKKTKWKGIKIVGKNAIADTLKTKKEKIQKKQPSKKDLSAVISKNKKKIKKSETGEPLKKLLNSMEDLKLEDIYKDVEVLSKKNYTSSEKLALKKGFLEVIDPSAYNGRYFIKNEKKWIHDIDALKARLGVSTDQEVKHHGYDVDTYYATNKSNNKHSKPRALRMCDTKDSNDQCPYSLNDMVYMSDGVYIHKDDCWW